MVKKELHKESLEYLKRLDKEKEEMNRINPKCVKCGKRIFGPVYEVEDKNLEKRELVFHKRCFDKDYISDYLKKKK